MFTWEMVVLLSSTVRKVTLDQTLTLMFCFTLKRFPGFSSGEGAVTVRVPSTIRVGVELRGTSVDVQDEAVVHGVKNTTDDFTTLRGKLVVLI